jgi:hypothetical protein
MLDLAFPGGGFRSGGFLRVGRGAAVFHRYLYAGRKPIRWRPATLTPLKKRLTGSSLSHKKGTD